MASFPSPTGQAFGKPTGLVARVNIGQIIFSVRSKESNLKHVIEALRRCKYKFPGRQNIIVSNKWSVDTRAHIARIAHASKNKAKRESILQAARA